MPYFVFKKLFSETRPLHHYFIYFRIHEERLVCSNMPLFYGSVFIKSCFELIKLKIVVLISHLNNTIFNEKHKRLIRKVFMISIRHNIWFFL